MIVFDLKCENGHQFESWFKSSSAYEDLKAGGHIECPFCNSTNVTKAPMAPNVAAKGNQRSETTEYVPVPEDPAEEVAVAAPATTAKPEATPELKKLMAEAEEVFDKIRKHVEDNCDNVGQDFAEEARKIHYGEAEERGIYGTATREETEELLDEGIDVMPIPTNRVTDA